MSIDYESRVSVFERKELLKNLARTPYNLINVNRELLQI